MADEQVQQLDEDAADTDEPTVAAEDSALAAAVDEQAAASSGADAAAAPEVPDDARDTIARAQAHIESLNMDKERAAAAKTTRRL